MTCGRAQLSAAGFLFAPSLTGEVAQNIMDAEQGCHSSGLSWPLSEQTSRLDFGDVLNSVVTDVLEPRKIGAIGLHHAGVWECNLADDSLTWSGGVYDLFGLQRSDPITRNQALAHYSEDSRAKLERLRSHAISNSHGFTLDVKVYAAVVGKLRQVRIIGAPVYSDGVPVRLHGLKIAR